MIWKQHFTLESLKELGQGTLFQHIGITFTEFGEDYLIAKMPVDERTKQPMGLLHGGASVTLAETLGSVGSTLCLEDMNEHLAVGLEINANHLSPVFEGYVYGKATPIKLGRKIHVWNIDITDDQGKKVCISRLTIAIIDKK